MAPSPPAVCPEGTVECGEECIQGCCTSNETPGKECGEACIDPANGECCRDTTNGPTVGSLCGDACYDASTQCCQDVSGTKTVWDKCGDECIDPATQCCTTETTLSTKCGDACLNSANNECCITGTEGDKPGTLCGDTCIDTTTQASGLEPTATEQEACWGAAVWLLEPRSAPGLLWERCFAGFAMLPDPHPQATITQQLILNLQSQQRPPRSQSVCSLFDVGAVLLR